MQSILDSCRRAAQAFEGPQAVLKDMLKDRFAKAAHGVQRRLRAAVTHAQARRPQTTASTPETTWMTLVRPTFGDERTVLRRAAEPVVAIVSAAVLVSLTGVAVISLAGFVLACLVAMAILTQIFGLSLDLDLPRPQAR